MQRADNTFRFFCFACAGIAGLLVAGIFAQLLIHSTEAWSHFGLTFIRSCQWDPARDVYGALPHIAGTLLTTAIALSVAIPLAFAIALLTSESTGKLTKVLSQSIDLLAAIPSVIYGMWGLFVLVPIMQDYVQPFLAQGMGLIHLPGGAWVLGEDGYGSGFGFLTAGMILALMILPYISAVMRDVFLLTPAMLRESAYGLGCTRWEVTRDVVVRYGIRGILGGIFIGMGRALGETMAVLFVIGNMMELPAGLYSSGTTIAATLANNFAEAMGLQKSALFAVGLLLLLMCFAIQFASQYYLNRISKYRSEAL